MQTSLWCACTIASSRFSLSAGGLKSSPKLVGGCGELPGRQLIGGVGKLSLSIAALCKS